MVNILLHKRSDVPGKVPLPASLEVGQIGINTADGKLFTKLDDGSVAAVGARSEKSVAIAAPTGSEKVVLFYARTGATVAEIRSLVLGPSSPSVTFSLRFGTDVSGAGTEVVPGGVTCTNSTTGLSTTSFANGTIPAGRWVWLTTSAASGEVDGFHATIGFD